MTKLTDLDPMWLDADGRSRMGLLFQCPACRDTDHGHGIGHYIAVYFANPVEGGQPATKQYAPTPRWQRTGETFEVLSLTPSIDIGCWHGYVTNGDVR